MKKTKRNSPIEAEHISLWVAWTYIVVLMTIACAGGLWLYFRTNWMMFFIGGAILANNIADHDRDKINGRATMPIVFGIKKAVNFYYFLEYMPYVAIILSVIFRFAPIYTILTLGTFPWVKKNVDKFVANPDKQKTFMTSIFNFHIVVATEIVTMFIGFLLHF